MTYDAANTGNGVINFATPLATKSIPDDMNVSSGTSTSEVTSSKSLSSSEVSSTADVDMTSEDHPDLNYKSTKNMALPNSSVPRSFAPIELLPPELITHVFSFLTEKENQYFTLLVCKSWYSATVDTLWFRPNILQLPTLELLLKTLDTPPAQLTVDYASLLRRINLTNLPQVVEDSMLLRMATCTKLERLTLAGCSKLTDDSLVPLLERNQGILSVDITNLEMITDKTLMVLANNCPKLQGLYASGCKRLTDSSINALARNCPNLKRMKLNGCHLLTDGPLRNLINSCPLLVELDLTGCMAITDDTARLAFTHLSQLREYRLSLDVNITDHTLLTIPSKLSLDKLRIIDFSGCALLTDEGVGRLVSLAPRLRNVVLAKCYNITDRGLLHLTKLGRNLHYMHLGHCNNITNMGVGNLVRACNRIQYIDVACCNQLQDQAVKDIAQLPKLRRVGLVKCQNITDIGISAFTQRGTQDNTLERIHLSYCSNISLQAVTHLVNSCQRLTHLSLTGVPAFMREDLLQFCREPPPEFTQHQQQVFCVFSGQGVRQLRDQLNILATEHRLQHQRMVEEYINHHAESHQAAANAAFQTTAALQAILPNIHQPFAMASGARPQQHDAQDGQAQQEPIPPPLNVIFNFPQHPAAGLNTGLNTAANPAVNPEDAAPLHILPFHIPNQQVDAAGGDRFTHARYLQLLQEQQHLLALQVMARGGGIPNMVPANHPLPVQQQQQHQQVQSRETFMQMINNPNVNANNTENPGIPGPGSGPGSRIQYMLDLASSLTNRNRPPQENNNNQGQVP